MAASAADRVCATCGRGLTDAETHCPTPHGIVGGVFGLPREVVDQVPRNRRHVLGMTINDEFVVTGFLGSGGFGAVYRARQIELERDVALKLLAFDQVGDSTSVERFKREARTAASLLDPNIATLFAFGETQVSDAPRDRLIFMAMELVEGPTLAEFIHQTKGTDLPTVFLLGRNILRGLAAAHDQGVVHRDLKPSNVVIDTGKRRPWFARLIDFGIASLQSGGHTTLRSEGTVLGTPKYMAPEQWLSKPTSPATDVYAFGTLLVELITGQPAVPKDEPRVMCVAHCQAPRPVVTDTAHGEAVPDDLQSFIQRCMAIRPEDRFQTARDALIAFEIVASGYGFEDTSVSATPAEVMREARALLPRRSAPAPASAAPVEAAPAPAPSRESIALDETHDGSSLQLQDPHPSAVDLSRAVPVDPPPADAPPATPDAWLQAWDDAVEDQAKDQVKHLPDAYARALEASLPAQLSDAEFSFGPPDAAAVPVSRSIEADDRALSAPPPPADPPPPAPGSAPAPRSAPEWAPTPADPAPAAPTPADPASAGRAQPASAPGPVRDSDADESWGVAGAEMLRSVASPTAGPRRAQTAPRRPQAGMPPLIKGAIALVVVVAGLVTWRIIARQQTVEDALAKDAVQPTVGLSVDELSAAAPATPSSASPSAPASAAAPDGGAPLAAAESVLVIVDPGGVRFSVKDAEAPLCDNSDQCRVAVDADLTLEKSGYKTRVLSADDLFDRKGSKWKVMIYPEP